MTVDDLQVYFRQHDDRDRITIGFLPWWYQWVRAQLQTYDAKVPCPSGCAACCLRTDIELVDGLDDPTTFRTQVNDRGVVMLQKRHDGACTYLTDDNRCSVYATRPYICRVYDCRAYSAAVTVIVDPNTEEITHACAAALTTFQILPITRDDRAAMRAVKDEMQSLKGELKDGNVLCYAALMTWPRRLGGPALSYLQTLERKATVPKRLRGVLRPAPPAAVPPPHAPTAPAI